MIKQPVRINGERLQHTIEKFAAFGKTRNGGITRLALSKEDIQARNHFVKLCEEAGMTVKWDDMGNIYARLDGVQNDKQPVVIGSHLDSVEKGGRFDGTLGVLAGLEVVRTIKENGIKPRVPIVLVDFTNEEGASFEPSIMSSGVLSGKFKKSEVIQSTDQQGNSFKEALESSGFEGSEENRLKEAKAFLELHIEQGPVLENESYPIGVVECVVGMVCYEIEVIGESDHAGTTPMNYRKDALFATNNLITEIREQCEKLDSDLVYTIGRMNIKPNIHTVIPNNVVFTVEARHQHVETLEAVEEMLEGLVDSAGKEGCSVNVNKLWSRDTVWFDEQLVNLIEQAANGLGYPSRRMVSGAGHDAQFIATYIPTAMLFIPSRDGKSHHEDEYSSFEDCNKGVNVLMQTVLDLVE